MNGLSVKAIEREVAIRMVIKHHYLHRKSPASHTYGLFQEDRLVGVVIFGTPASRHLQKSACPSDPGLVIELNRLWVHDDMGRNTESWFLARALNMLPPYIVVSYADTKRRHLGYVYRASNFYYAGWTDMERNKPRFDYVSKGKHSRDAFRSGKGLASRRVRRKPKVKYWIVTGNARDRRNLKKQCAWPQLSWKELPPPSQHQKRKVS